jgi:radical SAM superfamily enzyme YgiQ (UPF0313 family)
MSSLGYQQIYRLLNEVPDVAADRAMLPDDVEAARGQPWLTLERSRPVSDYPMLAFSVAYELELLGLITCLELAGIPVLAEDRGGRHPLIVAGGPLTFSNPVPLAPYIDIVILGEGEELACELVVLARDLGWDRDAVLAALRGRPGYYLPTVHGDTPPPIAIVDNALLPARSQILTPDTELSDMFLTEAARGCSRGCTYCVMRRSTNGGMRVVPTADVLAGIPAEARRVGLVGAAVTDHPDIRGIVRGVVDGGREVGISSLRADKLDDELVGLLARGGYRTLTVAADGASERMRRIVERSTQGAHLLNSAVLAARHKLATVKIYMMVGVPGETDDDIDELVRFAGELVAAHPKVAFGVAPFVAKRHTPLDGSPFAGIDVVEARLDRLRAGLARYRGKARCGRPRRAGPGSSTCWPRAISAPGSRCSTPTATAAPSRPTSARSPRATSRRPAPGPGCRRRPRSSRCASARRPRSSRPPIEDRAPPAYHRAMDLARMLDKCHAATSGTIDDLDWSIPPPIAAARQGRGRRPGLHRHGRHRAASPRRCSRPRREPRPPTRRWQEDLRHASSPTRSAIRGRRRSASRSYYDVHHYRDYQESAGAHATFRPHVPAAGARPRRPRSPTPTSPSGELILDVALLRSLDDYVGDDDEPPRDERSSTGTSRATSRSTST